VKETPVKHIAICGAGLAGTLCAAALVKILPDDIELSLINVPGSDETDVFYGTVTSPNMYEFLLNIGITEPDLLPKTNTTFSLGTHYLNWGADKRSWIQSFHKPLPIFQGVEFHHYLARLGKTASMTAELEPYIMSTHAAYKGVFAHPPEDKKTPLSSVEYGYHFLSKEWRALLSSKIENSHINKISGNVKTVHRDDSQIHSITLTNDQIVKADLYIDCIGLKSKLTQAEVSSARRLKAIASFSNQKIEGNVCRMITGTNFGWHAETVFQNGVHRLTIFDSTCEELDWNAQGKAEMKPLEVPIGYFKTPWRGNCLALGHNAAILEPLTPAPMMLLQPRFDIPARVV